MEKSSKGPKPVKLPEVLFSSWTAVINNYCQLNPENKLIAPAVALQKLASLKHATWDKQASCIKDSGKMTSTVKQLVFLTLWFFSKINAKDCF